MRPSELGRKERKKEARAGRKDGRKEAARRARPLLRGGPLLFRGFSALVPPRARRKKGGVGATRGNPRKKGESTSRARVSARTSATEKDPLLRPHYIVYLSSEPPPFLVFFLLLPARLLRRYLLALRLLVSRNKQLPSSLAYKSATRTYAPAL